MHDVQFHDQLLKVALEYYSENDSPFQGCLIVGMQHMLGTTVEMFRVMQTLGLKSAIVGSKLYSDNQDCIENFKKLGYHHVGCQEPIGHGLYQESIVKDIHQIWECALRVIKTGNLKSIIVLDDGADLLLNIPNEIYRLCRSEERFLVGIEQTKGGSNRTFFNGLPLPIIHVAGAAIKSRFEYQWVAKEVVRILGNDFLCDIALQLGRKPRIGIIGYGIMGLAVANELQSQAFQISIYDPKTTTIPEGSQSAEVTHVSSSVILISGADVIIGCTGTDVTASRAVFDALHYSPTPKWLVSTSSKDLEFNFLLHKCQEQTKRRYCTPDVLQTVVYRNHYGSTMSLLRGGFPINFQNTIHCVPPEKIWPTRAGLLLAALMALKYQKTLTKSAASTVYQLDPWSQMLIYHHYAQVNPTDPQLKSLQALSDQELCQYFCTHSQGEVVHHVEGRYDAHDAYDASEPTLSHMPSHAYVKDLNGAYLACNDPFIQASGFGSRRAIIGKTDQELWPSSSARLRFIDLRVLETQKQTTLIETVETQEGIGSYLSIKMPFYSHDKLIGIIGNSIPFPTFPM